MWSESVGCDKKTHNGDETPLAFPLWGKQCGNWTACNVWDLPWGQLWFNLDISLGSHILYYSPSINSTWKCLLCCCCQSFVVIVEYFSSFHFLSSHSPLPRPFSCILGIYSWDYRMMSRHSSCYSFFPRPPRKVLHHDRQRRLHAKPGHHPLCHLLALQTDQRTERKDWSTFFGADLSCGGVG